MKVEVFMAVTAIFSFLAAAASAVAAWRMPSNTAKFAEQLRRENDETAEKQRNKLHVFAMLMQERAAIYSDNGVKALNLVDVVFNDCAPVRTAWAELFQAFFLKPLPDHIIEERLRKLLAAMANDLRLADSLRPDDLARVYQPTAIVQDRLIRDVQRQNLWNALQQQGSPASNVKQLESPFPPKPEPD